MLGAIWWHILAFFGVVDEAGPGYGFWSGFAGDLTIFAAIGTWLWHHNCHVKGCWRLGHPHEGKVACRKHHSEVHPLIAARDAAFSIETAESPEAPADPSASTLRDRLDDGAV